MSDGLRGIVSWVRRAVRWGSAQEGEAMSALHRLKAYFGMVPVDEFDAAQFDSRFDATFDATGFTAPEFDAASVPVEGRYAAERPAAHQPRRAGLDDYDDGFPAPAGHYVVPRVHPTRSPSSSTDTRRRAPRAAEPWGMDAAVRGSLAIDTATAEAARTDGRPTTRQPATSASFLRDSRAFAPESRVDLCSDDDAHPLSRIVTLHPHSYNEARPIGERYREGNPVIMNLTAMEDRDAKRLVDFAAGLAFALRGSIDKVTNKVFLLSPPDVEVSAEDRRRIAEGRPFH